VVDTRASLEQQDAKMVNKLDQVQSELGGLRSTVAELARGMHARLAEPGTGGDCLAAGPSM